VLDTRCSTRSVELDEPVAGTAVVARHWILLELDAPWARKAIDSAGLGARVRAHIEAALVAVPNARLQLIRRPDTGPGAVRLMIVSMSDSGERTIRAWRPASLDDVCDIDLTAACRTLAGGTPVDDPLVLVCTHGRRDRCCAIAGVPVFRALHALQPQMVWQTSHLGGHRFAATAVVFPAGVQYGRLGPTDAPALLDAVATDTIMALDRYRGRTGLSRPAQVAAIAIRAEALALEIQAVQHVRSEPCLDDGGGTIEHCSLGGKMAHRVVTERAGHTARSFSCGDPRERVPPVFQVRSTD
jgi:hypothetical protein